MIEFSNISTEDFAMAQDIVEGINKMLVLSNLMVNNANWFTKEQFVMMTENLVNAITPFMTATAMLIDVEIVSRKPESVI